MSDTDWELLARYTRHRAEDAFAELVRRHLDLVHSAARRQVRSPHLAEEVAQSTFLKLAQNAPQLAPDTVLTAWLYQVTRREAIDVVRREARRQLREQIATEMNALNATTADWTHIEPLLDEAMHALDETDRAAVLLRYFENKSLREVGQALGASENAAQKRLVRAVERLREYFTQRGISVGASGLVAIIGSNAVQAAPAGLAASVSISAAAALAGTVVATTATSTATQTFIMTTLQKTLVAATLLTAVGTGIYEARQASTLRSQLELLQREHAPLAGKLQQLQHERDDAASRLAALAGELSKANSNPPELLKLRGEVNRLHNAAATVSDPDVQALLESKSRLAELKQRLVQMPEQNIPQLQALGEEDWLTVAKHAKLDTDVGLRRALGQLRTDARGQVSGLLSAALTKYVQANGGQLPDEVAALKPYFKSAPDDGILQQYQISDRGAITEKSPLEEGFDTTFFIEPDKFGVERSGPLEEVLGRFYEANPGKQPAGFSDLRGYAKNAAELAALQKWMP
jgi:RNA polymerase sigma factor (sigma-70 family)